MKNLKTYYRWLIKESLDSFVEELKQYTDISKGNPERLNAFLSRKLVQVDNNEGSHREVWIIDNKRLLKSIITEDDRIQNQNEISNSNCLGRRHAAQVFDYDPKFSWIIVERLQVPGENIVEYFHKTTGLFVAKSQLQPFFYDAVAAAKNLGFSNWSSRMSKEHHQNLYEKNGWYTSLIDHLRQCDVDASDFHYNNWGVRIGSNEPVLIDLGF